MNRYYYTFGTDPQFPYYRGWVEVLANNWEDAHEKFRAKFPDRHKNCLNCAFFYDEKEWVKSCAPQYFSATNEMCHEIIK